MPNSIISPKLEYSEEDWIVTIFNTSSSNGKPRVESLLAGHSALLIEGLEPETQRFQASTPFIGQYEILAATTEVQTGSTINVKGVITTIRVFENEACNRPAEYYQDKQKRSVIVNRADAKRAIASIYEDRRVTQEAVARGSGHLTYQKLGSSHPAFKAVRLFLPDYNLDGVNCTEWCLEKMEVAGISTGFGKPKPAIASSNCTIL